MVGFPKDGHIYTHTCIHTRAVQYISQPYYWLNMQTNLLTVVIQVAYMVLDHFIATH